MTNATSGIIANSLARYDPFGNYRTWPGSNVNPLIFDRGFTGHVHDNTGPYPTQNVGLIYMNARYYLPEVGRFVSPDSIVPDPANPQSYNRYSYVRNSPLNFTDPTGHRECQILCEGDTISEQEIKFGSAYGGEWNPEQQAANRGIAETVLVDAPKTAVGFLWEPADWYFALEDGFQAYDTIGMVPFVPASVGRYADEGVAALRLVKPTAFDIVPYRPTNKVHGLENHHGVLDAWASANIPGYVSRKGDAPTVALTVEQHKATITQYWEWIKENTFGRGPNWNEVSPRQIQDLSRRMFDAAGVPQSVQEVYFRAFNQYIYTGGWHR